MWCNDCGVVITLKITMTKEKIERDFALEKNESAGLFALKYTLQSDEIWLFI